MERAYGCDIGHILKMCIRYGYRIKETFAISESRLLRQMSYGTSDS